MPRTDILDTGPVIAIITEIGYPELLSILAGRGYVLVTPPGVVEEITNEPTTTVLAKLIQDRTIEIQQSPAEVVNALRNRYPMLGQGELEVLALGRTLDDKSQQYRCILDDLKARRTARKMNLTLIGTIGLIRELKLLGIITSKNYESYVQKLKEKGFRFSFDQLRDNGE